MTNNGLKRTKRQDPGGARLTARDLLALAFMAEAQPITTVHFRKLLGVSQAVAWRRLRTLRNLGMVQVHVVHLNDVNRYTLAPAARPVLARALGRSPEEFPTMRGIGRVNLAHHDGVVDLYVALKLATARSKVFRLESFLFERDIRRHLGNLEGMNVPDVVAVLEHRRDGRFAVAFEVDLATENPSYVARHKGLPYSDRWEDGEPLLGCLRWIACLTTTSIRRRNKLVKAFLQAGIAEGCWFFSTGDCMASHPLFSSATWVTPRVTPASKVKLVSESPFQTVRTKCSDRPDGLTQVSVENHETFLKGRSGSLAFGVTR